MSRSHVEVRLEPLTLDALEGLKPASEPGTSRDKVDVCVLPWFEDERPLQGLLGMLDWRRHGSLSAMARERTISGARGESVLLPAGRGMPAERLVLLGCGLRTQVDASVAFEAGEEAVRVGQRLCPTSVAVALPGADVEREVVESLFTGVLQGLRALDVGRGPGNDWSVVVETRYVARLRRLLDGPLRAAAVTSLA